MAPIFLSVLISRCLNYKGLPSLLGTLIACVSVPERAEERNTLPNMSVFVEKKDQTCTESIVWIRKLSATKAYNT